jgi:hypothetical protein
MLDARWWMALRRTGLLVFLAVLARSSAEAEEWSSARIARLPDSAFAVVEISPDGRKVRHLPHHDATGAVDPPHLRAARARLAQVKWLDPVNASVARRHLESHSPSWRVP